ncbi:MAG: hypothetical protein Q9N62_11745 [Ghiorsea sp.]|nr:hypothetical protein [Ghiorsea sp.]
MLSQFRAILYRNSKEKLSFETVLYSDTFINYEFSPKVYYRELNGKLVTLIHLHGVVSGNGMCDDENLFVLEESGVLSKVDVSNMYSQTRDSIKKGCYLKGHSRLSEKKFIYFAEERCLTGGLVVTYFQLKRNEDAALKYSLEIIPNSFKYISRELASELFKQ